MTQKYFTPLSSLILAGSTLLAAQTAKADTGHDMSIEPPHVEEGTLVVRAVDEINDSQLTNPLHFLSVRKQIAPIVIADLSLDLYNPYACTVTEGWCHRQLRLAEAAIAIELTPHLHITGGLLHELRASEIANFRVRDLPLLGIDEVSRAATEHNQVGMQLQYAWHPTNYDHFTLYFTPTISRPATDIGLPEHAHAGEEGLTVKKLIEIDEHGHDNPIHIQPNINTDGLNLFFNMHAIQKNRNTILTFGTQATQMRQYDHPETSVEAHIALEYDINPLNIAGIVATEVRSTNNSHGEEGNNFTTNTTMAAISQHFKLAAFEITSHIAAGLSHTADENVLSTEYGVAVGAGKVLQASVAWGHNHHLDGVHAGETDHSVQAGATFTFPGL